jgi:outer membrane receptor protein involved in Fe transport
VLALAVAAAGAAPLALAQDASERSEEVIVTGSRLAKSAFTSPTPVNVVGAERMQALAIPSVADALNQIPSFRAISSPAANLFRVSGNIGARAMDLRGLGTSRTLVLVDGQRFVPSSDNGSVDLNAIPSALVKRAEVVTGGASAAYGADAVAGVVNLILDTDYTGFKADINAGISAQGDAQNYFASFAGGRDFAGGRGHVIAGFEWQNEQGVGRCKQRDHCADFGAFIANPAYNTTTSRSANGQPANIFDVDIRYATNRQGVLVSAVRTVGATNTTLGQQVNNTGANLLPAALRGRQFDAQGNALIPFQFGDLLSGLFMRGGDPSVDDIFGFGDQPLVTQSQHASFLAHADYDLTDNMQLSGEVMFSSVVGGPTRAAAVGGLPVNIKINNPFITPATRAAILAADPAITSINVNSAKVESNPQSSSTSTNDTLRTAIALKGSVFEDAKWDVSYTYGKTDGYLKVRNSRLRDLDTTAVDAITPPGGYAGPIYRTPAGAQVICASSVAAPTNGCIPANYLGLNSLTPEVLAKYMKDAWQSREIYQQAAAANFSSTIFNTWAGAVSGAVGVEWREDGAEGDIDGLSKTGVFATSNTSILPKVKRDVTEAYVETSIPLLTDLPFAKNLTIDGAKRWTNYSTSGEASTWKAGVVYEPNGQILTRFTQSSDIRAPSAAELNPNATSGRPPFADPFGGGTHSITQVSGGNPNLNLEEADTKTAGIVLKPSFIPGLRLSSDYYLIKVAGAIDTQTVPNILAACFQRDLLCNLITFSGAYKASPADTVFTNFQNLSKLRAEGVELVANYSFDALAGNVDLSLNGNYIMDLRTISATGVVLRLDGVTGNFGGVASILGVPQYKLDSVATYSRDNWSLTAQWRYVPEGMIDASKIGPDDARFDVNNPNSISTNRVNARSYVNLSGTYSPKATIFGGKTQIYGSIANVFDTEEPIQLRTSGNALQFDPVGRAFRIGVRANW